MSALRRNDMRDIIHDIIEDYENDGESRVIDEISPYRQPDQGEIISLIGDLFKILFPGYFREQQEYWSADNQKRRLGLLIEEVAYRLSGQIRMALRFQENLEGLDADELEVRAHNYSLKFLGKIPKIREALEMDLQAAFDGDPATGSKEEIILAYPGFYAIAVNRMAHELYLMKIPLIPRIMTEHAHSKTGIDIHPGATIGRYFFIDHGTGVVVGETTVIGDYVKLYQGVTLGALSTRGGQSLRGHRRHPTIEDNVTIYSGASILGGETVIGKDAVVGSNVFITKSIAPGTRVSIRNQELIFKHSVGKKVGTEDFEIPGQDNSWFYVI